MLKEVRNVLRQLCLHTSELKFLPIMFGMSHNKNKSLKLNLLLCYETILYKHEANILRMSYFDQYLKVLIQYITDKEAEVRDRSKSIFC